LDLTQSGRLSVVKIFNKEALEPLFNNFSGVSSLSLKDVVKRGTALSFPQPARGGLQATSVPKNVGDFVT